MNIEQMNIAELQAPLLAKPTVSGRPVRIQRNRQSKQVSPNGLPIRYVGRPSVYGNLYKIGIDGDAELCIEKYKNAIKNFHETIKKDLSGQNLSCWCKIGERCHADVLLEIANR